VAPPVIGSMTLSGIVTVLDFVPLIGSIMP
jgi:hypothetical protein